MILSEQPKGASGFSAQSLSQAAKLPLNPVSLLPASPFPLQLPPSLVQVWNTPPVSTQALEQP